MNKFAICCNPSIENAEVVVKKLKSLLNADLLNINELKFGYDFVFVIGGDGTILKAARYYSKYNTSIFGVNLGHLGYLSQAGIEDLEIAVNKIINGDYYIEKRLMLEANGYNALNDFVIKGQYSSRASNFKLEIDGKFVCEYFADGIIISTPTGSTAYNMAAGGPVLAPDLEALVVVPICPHTFSARPLVISSNSIIKIFTPENSAYCVSADGQEVFGFSGEITIQKSENHANLALLNKNDFYTVLRNKLHWGVKC